MRAIYADKTTQEYINTVVCDDGYELRYRFWPGIEPPVATIVLVPGMMSHSGWFQHLAHLLTELHMDVVGADRRGSGLNECSRGDAPSREILVSDLRKIIEHERRDVPLYVVGWCWGALVAVNAALELGDKLSGIVLLAPGLFPSKAVKRAAQNEMTGLQDQGTNSPVLRSPVSAEMFSDRFEVRDYILNDVLAQRMFTPQFFRVSGQMALIAATRWSQLTQPLLVLLASNDAAVNNDQTLMALRFLRKTEVTVAILPCNHGMHFEIPDEIVRHIVEWLKQGTAHRHK